MSVDVFCTEVLIEDTIFSSSTGDGAAILSGHPSNAKVYPSAGQREYLKTLRTCLCPGIEPVISRSDVKRQLYRLR